MFRLYIISTKSDLTSHLKVLSYIVDENHSWLRINDPVKRLQIWMVKIEKNCAIPSSKKNPSYCTSVNYYLIAWEYVRDILEGKLTRGLNRFIFICTGFTFASNFPFARFMCLTCEGIEWCLCFTSIRIFSGHDRRKRLYNYKWSL